jgi:hypothetical protein
MALKNKDSKPQKPTQIIAEVIEQRKASMRFFNENYYSELAEVYRNLNARTKPHKYMEGNQEEGSHESSARTNVCVPDHHVMWRRGTARLTRNPPNLRVRGGPDTDQGQFNRDKVSAKLMYNWDRAESQRAFKKVVSEAYAFGYAVGKSYYDEVPIVRRLRRLTASLQPEDFDALANAKDPRTAAAVQQFGPRLKDKTPLSPDEVTQMTAALGDEVALDITRNKYKGPVLDHVFFGDFFPEPGFKSLPESGYVIENSQRDQEWLEYWMEQTTINPETGEETPVFDEKACQKVMDIAGQRTYIDEQELSLRRRMREEIEIADPITAGKPIKAPKKRFMVDERHTFINGHLAIDFIGEESAYLGRLWYPWETYGRYQYSELILIPDLLGGIGLSTPRVTRFLLMLRNTRMNQTTDFINNKLLPLMKKLRTADQTAYDLVRTDFMRTVEVDNMNELEPLQDPNFPAEAWQDQASLAQQMQSTDPAIADYAPGTEESPGAGKFATTAKLQAKASDAVTADCLDNVNMFVRDVVELQLWMDQQAMDELEDVPSSYLDRIPGRINQVGQGQPQGQGKDQTAVSIRNAGAQARYIKISPMDMQEVYEILPEAGSTLSADDEFRVGALQQFLVLGERHPDIVNVRAIITKLAQATPGVSPEDVILPPPPPQPPVPPVKMNISLQIKWTDLAPDVQAAILAHEALPQDVTHLEGVGKMIQKTADAADAASELERPVDYNNRANGGTPPKQKGPQRGKK